MVNRCNGRVAQRITRLTTDQEIAGSNPAVLEIFFNGCYSKYGLAVEANSGEIAGILRINFNNIRSLNVSCRLFCLQM